MPENTFNAENDVKTPFSLEIERITLKNIQSSFNGFT
jgi:hypothetical protein